MEVMGHERQSAALAFDQLQQAYFLLDSEFRFTCINREAERMLVTSRDALLGRCVWDVYPELMGTRVEHACRAASQGTRSEFDHYWSARGRWYHLQVDPMEGSVIVGFREIIHQELSQDHLAESKNLLTLVSGSGLIGWFQWSIPNDEVIFSPEMLALYELAAGEAKPNSSFWSSRLHPEDWQMVESKIQTCLARRAPMVAYDFRARTANGSWRWIHCRANFSYDQHGEPLHMVGINIDVGNRKELEQDLQIANQRLAQSNEELQAFAHAVAHDLQSPLRTISGMTSLLSKRLEAHMDAESSALACQVQNGVQQMSSLISDLLDYSRVTNGFLSTGKSVDCNALFNWTLINLQSQIVGTGAVITSDPLPVVQADDQLIRIFQNLIDNAVKYRADQDPRIHVGAQRSGEEWLFAVRDNGIGFDMKFANRIFDPFRRLHGAGQYQGSGLGLAICRKLIERYGGRIWAESEPGAGSTFYFTLPAN